MAKYDQGNNATGIQQATQAGINQVAQTNEFENVNFTWQEEAEQTRSTALENHIAGIPIVDTKIKVAKTRPDLTQKGITDSFTTRDEVMSKLNMMDENFNYTDTYTNYINHGGAPLPGYEYAHEELLAQERYDTIFQKVEDGTMSYDTALMEAYGKDILATSFGIDVTSVAYWQNKFLNNDFSNPFTNRYLMDQVKQAAEEYHQYRLSGEYGRKNLADTQLATLVGDDLSANQIRDIFDWDSATEELDDSTLLRAISNNTISATARMIPRDDGSYYYLHTDGELYILDGMDGENHGTLHLDKDGEFEGIDLNNSGLVSFGRSTWTGFTGVFTGIVGLGADLIGWGYGLVEGCTDGSWDKFTTLGSMYDAWLQDDAAWLVDNGYVDLNQNKISWQDGFNFVGSMAGTIAGTMLLGGMIGSAPSGAGSSGKGLMGIGSKMMGSSNAGTRFAGKVLKGTGTALRWQTGNLGTNYGTVAGGIKGAFAGNATNLKVWGRRFGAAAVANTKNFFNDVQKMQEQNIVNGYREDFSDVVFKGMAVSTVNTIIDTAIGGGMDDNQWQAWTGRDYIKQSTMDAAQDELNKLLAKETTKEVTEQLTGNLSDSLKGFLRSHNCVIAINSGLDFAANLLTGSISATATFDEEGKLESGLEFYKNINLETAARAAVNTWWYSYRGQKREWNVALENINVAHKNLLNHFEVAKSKTNDIDKINTIEQVKKLYLEDYNKSKAATAEGKILEAMDNLNKQLSDGKSVAAPIKDAISEAVNPKIMDHYNAIYKNAEILYLAKLNRANEILDPTKDNTGFMRKMFGGLWNFASQNKTTYAIAKGVENRDQQTDVDVQKLLNEILIPEELIKSTETLRKSLNETTLKENESKLKATTGLQLKLENEDLYNELKEQDPEAANKHYFMVPNEADRGDGAFNENLTALEVMEDLGYITKVNDANHVFEIQPYGNQVEFVNTSATLNHIYTGVLAIANAKGVTNKTQLFSEMMNGLYNDDVTIAQRSVIATDVLNRLESHRLIRHSTASKIFGELQKNGMIATTTRVFGKEDIQLTQHFERYQTTLDILKKISKNNSKYLNLGEAEVLEAVEQLFKDGEITQEQLKTIKEIAKTDNFFQVGEQLSKSKKAWIDKVINDQFSVMVVSPDSIQDSSKLTENYRRYFKANGYDTGDIKLNDIVTKAIEEYKKIFSNSKVIGVDNSKVYIALDTFQGKRTNELEKRILQAGESQIKHIEDTDYFKEFGSDIYKELNAKNKHVDKNSRLLTFDLDIASDVAKLQQLLDDYNYKDVRLIEGNTEHNKKQIALIEAEGIRNFRGDAIILDIPRVHGIEALQDAIQAGSIVIGGTRYNFKDKVFLDANGKRLFEPDVVKAILDNVEVTNIDPRLNVSLKSIPIMQIMPFAAQEDYTFETIVDVALLGTEMNMNKMAGKAASQTDKALTHVMTKGTATKGTVDYNLEQYFILDMLVNKLTADKSSIPLSKEEVKLLKAKGIVDYKGHEDDTNFWRISGRESNSFLVLKDNASKMKEYILDDNFNVFKLFPVQLKEPGKRVHGMIDVYTSLTTEGIELSPAGAAKETGLQALNIILPWDDTNRSHYMKFLTTLSDKSKDLEWNPFDWSKSKKFDQPNPNDSVDIAYDAWYEKAKDSNDPYSILLTRYVDEYNKMIKGEEGKESYDNHTLIIKNEFALAELLATEESEVTPATVQRIKDAMNFIPGKNKEYNSLSKYYNTPTVIAGRDVESIPDQIMIGKSILESAIGRGRNLKVTAPPDMDWIDTATVQKALDIVRGIVTDEENMYRTSFFNNYMQVVYEENNATKLLTQVGGDNGYIQLEDIDTYVRLLAENYREAVDNQNINFKLDMKLEPILKRFWGAQYQEQVDAIFKQAKAMTKLNSTLKKTGDKAPVSLSSPSLTHEGDKTIDKRPDISEDGTVSYTGFNNSRYHNYLQNGLYNKEHNPKNVFHRLGDVTKSLVDDSRINEVITGSIEKDRLFHTSAPMNSVVQNFSTAHNTRGMMETTVNTYDKMLEAFKGFMNVSDESVKNNLMKAATLGVNLHVGVDYAGETTNFIILDKNGAVKDIDLYGSANLNDLLVNIYDKKAELDGCTIVKFDSQDIDNVAGLNMKYLQLSDKNFSNVVTDLYQKYIIDNSWYLNKKYGYTSVDQLLERFTVNKLTNEELQDRLSNIPVNTLSKIMQQRNLYETYKTRTLNDSLSKEEFYHATKGLTSIDTNEILRIATENSIENQLGVDDMYNKNTGGFKVLSNLINFGMNPDRFDSDTVAAIKHFKEKLYGKSDIDFEDYYTNLLKEIKEAGKLNREQQNRYAYDLAIAHVLNSSEAYNIDFIARDRSLLQMYEDSLSDDVKGAFHINSIDDPLNSKALLDLVKSMQENDPTIDTKYNRIIAFDTEASLAGNTDDQKYVFNIGLVVKEKTPNGWEEKRYDIYLDWASDMSGDTPEEWIRKYVTPYQNTTFFKHNKGYRDTIDNYKDIQNYIANNEEAKFLTPTAAKELFESIIGTNKDTIILGYNSDQADVEWLKHAGIFTDSLLKNVTHIDEKLLADTAGIKDFKRSGKQTERAQNIFGSDDTNAAHGGLSDALTTLKLFNHTVLNTYNVGTIRTLQLREIQKLFKDNGIKLSNKDMRTTLEAIDGIIKMVRDKTPELREHFSRDYQITTKNISAGTELMDFILNTRLNNLSIALYNQRIKDTAITKQGEAILETNNFKLLNKLVKFADIKGFKNDRLLDEINDEVGQSPTLDKVLRAIGTHDGIENILTRMGLDIKEFDEFTEEAKMFKGAIRNEDWIIQSQYDKYERNKDSIGFSTSMQKLAHSLDIKDTTVRNNVINLLARVYDFNKDIQDPLSWMDSNIGMVDSKISKQYKEYLKSNYGDLDAVMGFSKKGTYELIDSFNTNEEVMDLISGKLIKTDSSMALISKTQFQELMKTDIETYKKAHGDEIYTQLLIHPADGNNKVLPRRLIVVDSDLNFIKVPETVIETLGSRDFDGDHLILLQPDDYSQELLKTYTNKMFKTHNIQEATLTFMKEKGIPYDGFRTRNFIINTIGKDEDVLNICTRANELLSQGKDIKDLTKDISLVFESLLNKYKDNEDSDGVTVDKLLDELWLKEFDSYEEDRKTNNHIKFINNPAIYSIDGKLSFSGEERLKAESIRAVNKYLYAFIDQTTGMVQKGMIKFLEDAEINNPWTDMLISNIYGSSTVSKYFDNLKSLSSEDIEDFKKVLLSEYENIFIDGNDEGRAYNETKVAAKESIKKIGEYLTKGDTASAFDEYDAFLRATESSLRKNLNTKEIKKALTSKEMLQHYDDMKNRIEHLNKGVDLYNHYATMNKYFPSSYGASREATNYTINNILSRMVANSTMEYNKDVFENSTSYKTFIATSGFPAGSDVILYNNETTSECVGYSRSVVTLKDNETLANIKVGQYLPKGSLLAKTNKRKGDHITVPSDSVVEYINGNTVVLTAINPLDGQFKIATNYGGKGVVNSNYNIVDGDNDTAFILNAPNQSKLSIGYNKKLNSTKETTIKVSNGSKEYTLTGYYVDDVTPIVTEDTSQWKGLGDRKVDTLHIISDGKSIFGATDAGTITYDKDTKKLKFSMEDYKNLSEKLYKPHNYIQLSNILGGVNKTKMAYLLDKITDSELQQAFNTDIDAKELRHKLLNTNILCTEKYSNIVYTLANKFKDRINYSDELINKLFSVELNKLVGKAYKTGTKDIDIDKVHSKTDPNAQGTKGQYMSQGIIKHLSLDELNIDSRFESLEDYFLDAYTLYDYLFGVGEIRPYVVQNLTKSGKIPYGRFHQNATMENGYRNSNVDYLREKTYPQMAGEFQGSGKTSSTALPGEIGSITPKELDLVVPTENELYEAQSNQMNPQLLGSITDGYKNDTLYNRKYRVAEYIKAIEDLNPNMSLDSKLTALDLNTKKYKILDAPITLIYNEKGELVPTLNTPKELTGTAKELEKKVRSSAYNYSYYNILKNDEDSIDAKTINNVINTIRAKDNIDSYRNTKDEISKAKEALIESIKKDIIDIETGEVNDDIPLEILHKQPKPMSAEPAKVLSEKGEEVIIKESLMSRQGVDDRTKEGLHLDTALKNYSAGTVYAEQEPLMNLENINKAIKTTHMSEEDFKTYTDLSAIYAYYSKTPDALSDVAFKNLLSYHNIDASELGDKFEELIFLKKKYSLVDRAYQTHIEYLTKFAESVKAETGEPIDCIVSLMSPYKTNNAELNKTLVASTIHNALNINKHNPIFHKDSVSASLSYDFFNSSKAIIKELSRMYAASAIKKTLLDPTLGFSSNEKLIDKTNNLINTLLTSDTDMYIKDSDETREIQEKVINTIHQYVSCTITLDPKKNIVEQYKDLYTKLNYELTGCIEKFNKDNGTNYSSYSEFYNLAHNDKVSYELRKGAEVVSNYYWARMISAQGIIESSKSFAKSFTDYLNGIASEGYVLVNAYGQKYERNKPLNPLSSTSMAHLKESMGIMYNSFDEAMWNQFILEKILCGEIYTLKQETADFLEKNIYTTKIPSGTMKTLKEISKWSSALQMALPSKLLNRLISFTGFDYSMGIMYNPKTIKFMGPARRELLAAFQSKGTSMSEDLKNYMMKEGQPIGLTGKDPVTFSEDISGSENVMRVLNTLTDPLEFQNHLGRYAIYLAALESFREGDPWYGPVYYNKEHIDSLPTNEDKAMYVMDYMLGSPGGFPVLAKKTSGLMMYATFPMNFARTLGAYGMSLNKLFHEGYTSENSSQWVRTAFVPSMGAAAITGLSALITSWICDLFGVDDKTKEEMIKDLATIDPIGTIVGGTPTASSSSMNPVQNIKGMLIDPFTSEYNDTALKKVFGFVNTNLISHFNPAIKIPAEIFTGYDLYGASPMSIKYNYTNTENGLRKVLGFMIGSSTANAIVNQYKIDKYSNDATFLSTLTKGMTKGISSSLGNQKSYKKDTTNYYNNIYAVNNYKYKSSDYYSDDVEDFTTADSMERIRYTSSQYGQYNYDDYKRISNLMRKMINNKEEPAVVYSLIIQEYNNGVSEATLKTVLNNNSLVRKLSQIDTKAYLDTLDSKEYKKLIEALNYENEFYPLLQEFFPNAESSTYFTKAYKKKYYNNSGSYGSGYTPYPKRYYPSFVYPNSSTYYNKYKSYNPNAKIDKVQVKVSPEMAVWSNDYNAVDDLDKKEWYLDNPFYNNLNDYEKRQKGGN